MRVLALIALVITLTAAELPFKPPVAYACDMTFAEKKGTAIKGRMFVGGPDKQRMEMSSDEGNVIMIMRKDQKKGIMLMVDQKMAMTVPLNAAQGFKDPTQDDQAVWKKTGSEKVHGVACDTYEWTSGSEKGTAWIDAKQGVMVRVISGATQADFTNYQIGAQKADLFETPAGFQQMPGMGGMMGGQ